MAEVEEAMCIYCYAEVTTTQLVPAVDDDDAWEQLATEHNPNCEWIETRAHRRWANEPC